MSSATHKLLRFGVFELNVDTVEVRKSGTIMKLSPQPFRLLVLLATHSGQVVTREEIREQLWGEETYVDFEQGMNHCVKQIRTVLGDNADNPLYVETLPRRGYRFLAPVVSKNVPAPAPQIIKSQSGIQSASFPAIRPSTTPVSVEPSSAGPAAKAAEVNRVPLPSPEAAGRSEMEISSGVVPVFEAEEAMREEAAPSLKKDNSAFAAAEALAPEIARMRTSPRWENWNLAWIAAILVLVLAGILYWYLHRP
jgi:DNA-binding winged helix-turn-helix (wHTH) protein